MIKWIFCLTTVIVYVIFRLIEVKFIFKNSDKVHAVRKEIRTIIRESAMVGISASLATIATDLALTYSRSGFKSVWTEIKSNREMKNEIKSGSGNSSNISSSGGGGGGGVPIALGNFPKYN